MKHENNAIESYISNIINPQAKIDLNSVFAVLAGMITIFTMLLGIISLHRCAYYGELITFYDVMTSATSVREAIGISMAAGLVVLIFLSILYRRSVTKISKVHKSIVYCLFLAMLVILIIWIVELVLGEIFAIAYTSDSNAVEIVVIILALVTIMITIVLLKINIMPFVLGMIYISFSVLSLILCITTKIYIDMANSMALVLLFVGITYVLVIYRSKFTAGSFILSLFILFITFFALFSSMYMSYRKNNLKQTYVFSSSVIDEFNLMTEDIDHIINYNERYVIYLKNGKWLIFNADDIQMLHPTGTVGEL